MTDWSQEHIDITSLCQVCTASVFTSVNRSSIGFRSGDWLGHCRTFHIFCLKKSWIAFESLSSCIVKHHAMSLEAFGWVWADNIALYISEFILLLFSEVTSSVKPRDSLAVLHKMMWYAPDLFPPIWYKSHLWTGCCSERYNSTALPVFKAYQWWNLLFFGDVATNTRPSWKLFLIWNRKRIYGLFSVVVLISPLHSVLFRNGPNDWFGHP